jgi:hypothetical protein
MKMPSTYISLLLLCGLMLVYRYTQKSNHPASKPALAQPFVKAGEPVVKRFLSDSSAYVPLNKNQNDEKMSRQTGLNEKGFSFFRDVISHITPVLKYVK